MSRWEAERGELWRVVQQMAALGLVTGASGNASLCLQRSGEQGLVLITPSQLPYSQMVAADLLVVDFNGDPVEGTLMPSVETMMHVSVYQAREDSVAVVHTHSIYASVLAVAGMDLPPIVDELVVAVGGTVKVAGYGFPGSKELAVEAVPRTGQPPGRYAEEPRASWSRLNSSGSSSRVRACGEDGPGVCVVFPPGESERAPSGHRGR